MNTFESYLYPRKLDNFEKLDLCFNKITRDRRRESKFNNHASESQNLKLGLKWSQTGGDLKQGKRK